MFRAIILIDVKTLSILLKRTFPCIESKYKSSVTEYQPITSNIITCISNCVLGGLQDESIVSDLENVKSLDYTPVYDIFNSSATKLVAFEKLGIIYSCITYESQTKNVSMGSLSQSIILAHSMLQNMANHSDINQSIDSFLLDLYKYISIGIPFGIPNELDVNTVLHMSSSVSEFSRLPSVKSPSWRAISHKGKQTIHVTVKEKVSATLFDREEMPNHCEIVGTVFCKADVEEAPEISLALVAPIESGTLTQAVYHPCVQIIDNIVPLMKNDQKSFDVQNGSRKLRFCPPPEDFVLCHYKSALEADELPMLCYYQMRGDKETASVLLQIRLDKKMQNQFDKFEVFIPFFNRGPIKSFDVVQQSRNVVVCNNRSALLWNIGTKINSKGGDVTLEASINFNSKQPILVNRKALGSLDSYVLLNWRMNNFTYSGLNFDNKSVEIHPNSKLKVNSTVEFITGEYKVWNSHGNIAVA